MKALQRAAWSMIFLLFGVRMATAEEPEIQAQKMSEKDLYPIHQVDLPWKRMHSWGTCEWKWDERVLRKEYKEKRNSQGEDPRTIEGRGHKNERWRIQEKKKDGKWKKRRKKRKKRSAITTHERDGGVRFERFSLALSR